MLCPHSAAAQVKYLATGYGASILNASGTMRPKDAVVFDPCDSRQYVAGAFQSLGAPDKILRQFILDLQKKVIQRVVM